MCLFGWKGDDFNLIAIQWLNTEVEETLDRYLQRGRPIIKTFIENTSNKRKVGNGASLPLGVTSGRVNNTLSA